MREIAERLGATDLFVLYRVAPQRLVNVDGHGRGAGWVGNIDLDPSTERWLTVVQERGLARVSQGMPQRIFGPYWATQAVGVAVGDYVVVLGGWDVANLPDEGVRDAAALAVAAVAEVPVAKRLADDLEVTQAALAVARMRPDSLDAAARAIATTAARATSCEFGAVLLFGPPITLHLAEEGWRPSASEEEIAAALLPLAQALSDGLYVEQDTSESPFPYRPLTFEDGLVARCAVRLGTEGDLGVLVVAHSLESPRGFTMLCQRVMRAIGETAQSTLSSLIDSGVREGGFEPPRA
ncbi:MAG TPA: hypothetical protein VF097_00200 [Actinomycetota bacterium]